MRRGTQTAKEFGELLYNLRIEKGLTMRALADKIGIQAATVSQVEKAQRAVKEDKVALWAEGLGVTKSYLLSEWHKAHKEPDPPIVRRRSSSPNLSCLEIRIKGLTGPERARVLGYVDSLIEQRQPT